MWCNFKWVFWFPTLYTWTAIFVKFCLDLWKKEKSVLAGFRLLDVRRFAVFHHPVQRVLVLVLRWGVTQLEITLPSSAISTGWILSYFVTQAPWWNRPSRYFSKIFEWWALTDNFRVKKELGLKSILGLEKILRLKMTFEKFKAEKLLRWRKTFRWKNGFRKVWIKKHFWAWKCRV